MKTWYKIYLDNSGPDRRILIATVKSQGLCNLALNYFKTIYPEDRLFRVWAE